MDGICCWIAAAVILTVQGAVDVRQGTNVISVPTDEEWVHNVDDDRFLHLSPTGLYRNSPRYLVFAPKNVRPGQVYRVVVNILSSPHPLLVRASLHRDDSEEVTSAAERVKPGSWEVLIMQVPMNAKEGSYKLRVEGNDNGALGGSGFRNETSVTFSKRFLTVLIQTNKVVYNHKQPIKIRVVFLTTELKPYTDPVDIYLVDSRDLVMKRWFSVFPYLGIADVEFQLPSDFPMGWWKVRVEVLNQVEEKKIRLERWFGDRYDVNVTLPAFVVASQDFLEGSVRANHTNFAPVEGNLTLRAVVKPLPRQEDFRTSSSSSRRRTETSTSESPVDIQRRQATRTRYQQEKHPYVHQKLVRFYGTYDFKFSMEELRQAAGAYRLEDCEIEVRAYVGERFMNNVVTGYARTRFVERHLQLRFLGAMPQIFKPGMRFQARLTVSYDDNVPVEAERLESSQLRVQAVVGTEGGGSYELLPNEEKTFSDEDRVLTLDFDVSEKATKLTLRAQYLDDRGRAEAELLALTFYSSKQRYLQVETSTDTGKAGSYAIFHVRANFYMKLFNYMVVSKGLILFAGQEAANGIMRSITTFSVPISPEMAPSCTIFVYHVTIDCEVIADSITLPIEGINRQPLTLGINGNQDRTGAYFEIVTWFSVEAAVGVAGIDVDWLAVQGRNIITPSSVLRALHSFDEDHQQKITWVDREGGTEETMYFVTHNRGRDSNQTFETAGLVMFTDMHVTTVPNLCNESMGLLPCMSGGHCYTKEKHCNGIRDCPDGTDEGNCPDTESEDDLFHYHLYRHNRQYQFYDADGDFAWKYIQSGHTLDSYVETSTPKRPTLWKLSAVAVSREHGFAILENPEYVDGTNPFFICVEAPRTAVIGEQISMRVVLFNYQLFEIQAELILQESPDYKFVQVESFGIVSSYNPRTTSGEHQHLLYIKPQSHQIVYIPIVATRRGKITVTIIGQTQVAKDPVDFEIDILPDGIPIYQHTSMLLDMKSQAYSLKFLKLNVSDDPIIPFENQYRRFIFGSPYARLSIIGDVVGAPVSKSPVTTNQMRMSAAVKSGEHVMFNLAYNLYTLHYLRLTNQLNSSTARELLEYLNRAYVFQNVFFINGSFTMFKHDPSVWLTAYCARLYQLATYPGWEHRLYIDPKFISDSVGFLLEHQTDRGSFYETTIHPWNSKMDPRSRSFTQRNYYTYQNISLTAHVLITLSQVTDLSGDMRVRASNARAKARLFLEQQIPVLNDPYELAIVTYALSEAGSVEAEAGYYKLDQMKRTSEGMVYWSPERIPKREILYQSQRPFLQPRKPHKYDSVAVETTAYALLVLMRNGGLDQDKIVEWLNSMRFYDNVFVSTQDTIVALQALVEYSFRNHIRDVTTMNLEVYVSSDPKNTTQMLHVSPNDLAVPRITEVDRNVWGHVEVIAKGSGMAVLQLDLQYNVDRDFLLIPPGEEAFDLTVDYSYHGRNKSHFNMNACVRSTLLDGETSGTSVLEITLPTGYLAYKPKLNRYVQEGSVPHLRRARILPRTAVFMFEYLDYKWQCINFTAERWYPVANLTRYLKAKIYDYYMPERYKEVIFEDYELYVLNVCEVCGSYQCPYCPHFSPADKTALHWTSIVFAIALHLLLCGR